MPTMRTGILQSLLVEHTQREGIKPVGEADLIWENRAISTHNIRAIERDVLRKDRSVHTTEMEGKIRNSFEKSSL